MCGLVGALSLANFDRTAEAIEDMAEAILHRGPDAGGVWTDPDAGIALAHRRLSIVDLSPEGAQPMHAANERYVLSYNGEIYNHQAIRAELDGLGAQNTWRGHSDTETLLAAICQWGLEGAVQKSIGMFAIALWDRKTRRLYLARDRMGEKPLYYGWQGRHFLFGSELAALRRHPEFEAELDPSSIALMMRHDYIPAPYSVYKGIHKLPPGTILEVSADAPDQRPQPFWSLEGAVASGKSDPFTGSPEEAVDALEVLLMDSIGMQMKADVPLGAFLSGGIDSSTIVALMQAQSTRPVQTFTIGFNEKGYNEAEHAKRVAEHLGTEHTELYISQNDLLDVIPRLTSIYSEPFSDSSQIPTFVVSQLARQHVTVSLSGDGGDELFGGYSRYFSMQSTMKKLEALPPALRRVMASSIRALSPDMWNRFGGLAGKVAPNYFLKRNLGNMAYKLANAMDGVGTDAAYLQALSHWRPEDRLQPGVSEHPSAITQPPSLPDLDPFERMMALDTVSYLPDDILCKVDRATMAVSLEGRIPMLDHRVVEFAWSLPLSHKVRGRVGKWPLRQVLSRHVPNEIIDRPKMGFGVPIGAWLRGPLRDWAENLLDERRLREQGLFDPQVLQKRWKEHLGDKNWQYHLWDVLMVQAWIDAQAET